jgi:hypothetical protein
MYLLMTRVGYGFEHALRSSLFQVISFMTTTGMFSDNAAAWPHITWVIIGLLMFLGASAGSTSGGFKCVRGLMAFEVMRNEFRRILHPNAVLPVKVSGQPVPQSKITTLMAFLAIYVSICMLCSTIMVTSGIDMPNAIGISLGLISNVGPSLEQAIGEPMSWNDLSMEIKWICSFLMLVGRLEILTVLVLFLVGIGGTPSQVNVGLIVVTVVYRLSQGNRDDVALDSTLYPSALGVAANGILHVDLAILAIHDVALAALCGKRQTEHAVDHALASALVGLELALGLLANDSVDAVG